MDTLFHNMGGEMKRLARKSRATSQPVPVRDHSPSTEIITAQVSHHGCLYDLVSFDVIVWSKFKRLVVFG